MASFKDCLTPKSRPAWESLCKSVGVAEPVKTPELEGIDEIARIMQEPPKGK